MGATDMPRATNTPRPVPPGHVRISWADAHTALHVHAHADIFEAMSLAGYLTPERDGYRLRLPRHETLKMLLLGFQATEEII